VCPLRENNGTDRVGCESIQITHTRARNKIRAGRASVRIIIAAAFASLSFRAAPPQSCGCVLVGRSVGRARRGQRESDWLRPCRSIRHQLMSRTTEELIFVYKLMLRKITLPVLICTLKFDFTLYVLCT
jgi:hypothetical protein